MAASASTENTFISDFSVDIDRARSYLRPIAESVGTRGERKYSGSGGGHVGHSVVGPDRGGVAVGCHFKALSSCLS